MSGWRPISTAPKDGTAILAWPCWGGPEGTDRVEWRVTKRTARWVTGMGHPIPCAPILWMPLPIPEIDEGTNDIPD